MIQLLMLAQGILLFYGTHLFPIGGKLDKLRFICFGLIIMARLLLYPKFKLRMPTWPDLIALVILTFALVSYLYSFHPKLTLLRVIANLLMYLAIFWALHISCRSSLEVRDYIKALIVVWLIFYGVNTAFLLIRPQDSFQVHEAQVITDIEYQRFNGVTISPNAIGLFSALIFPLVLWNFRKSKDSLNLFLLISVIGSFFFSFSRDAFICSVFGASIYFYLSTKGHRVFIIVCAIFAIFLMIIYTELFGLFLPAGLVRANNLMLLGGRIEAWQAALELIQEHPWRGYGFGIEEFLFERFRYSFEVHGGSGVHNSFLGFALQLGWIPPSLLYLSLIIFLVQSFRKILKLSSEFRPLMSALYASIFSGFVISFFESWIYASGGILAFPFFVFIMFLMRLLDFEKNKVSQPIIQLSSPNVFSGAVIARQQSTVIPAKAGIQTCGSPIKAFGDDTSCQIASLTSPDQPSLALMRGALFGKDLTSFSESAGTGSPSGRPPLKQQVCPRNDVNIKAFGE